MGIQDFPISPLPSGTVTDPDFLYLSLGSFWTQVFQEQGTIKGYTLGQAEEMVQNYMNLIEVVHAYSVEDIPVFHVEKWFPIFIKKSQFNNVPLKFEAPEDSPALFGPQPSDDPLYANVLFKFGFPKVPVTGVYTFSPPSNFINASVIADKIINPSLVLARNADFKFEDSDLIFNVNLFEDQDIPKINLIGDDGIPVTFTDYQGEVQQDQLIIMWAYHADIDADLLFTNFGFIFDLKLNNDQFYKDVLNSVINLFVEGPTIKAIRNISCAFLGVHTVVDAQEEIQEIFADELFTYIVTDKRVYPFNIYYSLLPQTKVGTVVFAGDQLVDATEYFDNVQYTSWWKSKLAPKISLDNGVPMVYPNMAFPNYIFLGSYEGQLVLKNEEELMTMSSDGVISFPIHGSNKDVMAFNSMINNNAATIADAVGLTPGSSITINPLDFIFINFFKNNTALLKFNFFSLDQARVFLSFFDVIKDMFPKHVYFMFMFEFNFDTETYDRLNAADDGNNADGSNASGNIPYNLATAKLADPVVDQYCYAQIPIWDATVGEMNTVHNVQSNSTGTPSANNSYVKDGKQKGTIIPGSTNREVRTLSLLDFS